MDVMLIKFKVNRFRGFMEEVCWDLSHPSKYDFNTHAIKNGIVKNGIVFGPNGCGKSNFSKAVFDTIYHLTQKEKLSSHYQNYLYAGTPDKLVVFEYTFKFGDTIVEYSYGKDAAGRLMAESLKADGRPVFNKQPGVFEFDRVAFPINEDTLRALRSNANNISIVSFLLSSFPLSAEHYLMKLKEFVDGMLWFVNLDQRGYMGLETGTTNLEAFIIKEGLVDRFGSFLRDISGQEYHFVSPRNGEEVLFCTFEGNRVRFAAIASTGTRSLMLLFYWLQKMNKASFVFIDEFDAFYHFDLSYKVCELLFGLDCQVFTSSHNTSLMDNDLLRPDCFFILNNNKIKPFNECTDKELRFAHNLEKMYRGKGLEV